MVDKENLSGLIERVTFHSAETGFCVLRIAVKAQKDLITVVGHAPLVNVGEHIEVEGQWHHDRNYGLQFKALHLKIIQPHTVYGIEKYLGSGLIKGIGPHFAKKLASTFGAEVLNIIEQTPQRLKELEGIGEKRCQKIIESWSEQKAIREIMIFLQSHGIGSARAVRIYKTYGEASIALVKENPYRLAEDIHGIGFKTADELAKKLGIPEDSLIRAKAGVHYILQEHCRNGHCGMVLEALIKTSKELLNMPEETLKVALEEEAEARKMMFEKMALPEGVTETLCVFPTSLYWAEEGIAKHIQRLLQGEKRWQALPQAIAWAESQTQLNLSASQKSAVEKALHTKVMIITGGPGVGKTTIVKTLLAILEAQHLKITLCAPTGRAAKRLSEATGQPAKTIHRLLEWRRGGEGALYNEHHPLTTDFLVVDEASMIDVGLMHNLLRALPDHTGVLIVGDRDQLPSVGSGAVLSDLIHSGKVPTAKLNEIFRQSKTSDIILNAHRINQGKYPLIDEKDRKDSTDFYFIETDTPEKTRDLLITLTAHKIPEAFNLNPFTDIQVLTPLQKGSLGARSLNADLQALLNPQSPRISRMGLTFAVGDKVIQTLNNYDKGVFNGDMGFIKTLDLEEGTLTLDFEGKQVEYDFNELDEITLAYALTIHKSQGSEYPAVVIPVRTEHYVMLERNLLYTAVTRGKKLVVLVGQKKALWIAIKNLKNRERLTRLRKKLMQT